MELILGAVAYDPKVVTIWDGFQQYFAEHELPFDYILYTSYERQVQAHFAGQIQVAWNSPLAWLQSERLAARLGRTAEAIAMRDSDRDLTSVGEEPDSGRPRRACPKDPPGTRPRWPQAAPRRPQAGQPAGCPGPVDLSPFRPVPVWPDGRRPQTPPAAR